MKHNPITLILLFAALLTGFNLQAQTDCDPTGDGNPDWEDDGTGQGTGGSNNDANLSWEEILSQDCSGGEPFYTLQGASDLPIGGATIDRDYDPTGLCNSSSNVIPIVGSNSVKIAIIDSGVRPTSPGLFNHATLINNKVDSDGTITNNATFPPHPHGTFSAGVISGMLERQGFVDYEIHDYQVLNVNLRTSLTAVVAAIDDVIRQGDINLISLSIGFVPNACDNVNWESAYSPLYAALSRAEAAGVIVITSAGNDGNDIGVDPQYPAAYNHLSNVVSVGALACGGETPASFSNFGADHVDVFTAGDIVKVLYDGCVYTIRGTSFATSIVAAKAAIHFTNSPRSSAVLCNLRSETTAFNDTQYAIYGIVDAGGSNPAADCSRSEFPGAFDFGNGKRLSSTNTTVANVSPNPFQDEVSVTLDELDGLTTLTLFDAQGRQILTQKAKTNKVSLNLRTLVPGAYWLRIQNASGSETRTIVKQ